MVPSNDMGSFAVYLEKQREVRKLTEELEQLKSSQAVEAAIRIKHEIEALMADYELTPEQLLEAMCQLFDLPKPGKLHGAGLIDSNAEGASDRSEGARDQKNDSGTRGRRGRGAKGASARAGKQSADSGNQAPGSAGPMVPPRKVTIRSAEERSNASSSNAEKVDSGSSSKAPSTKASGTKESQPVTVVRKKRAMKVYTNPHTGEVVRTRGANHRTLNQWRTQHGHEAVDSWWKYES